MLMENKAIRPLMPLLCILFSLLWAYFGTIEILVKQWLVNEDFSHGILIFPTALYLTWLRRERLRTIEIRTDWRAVFLIMTALAFNLVGELGAELFIVRFSLIMMFIGAVWLVYGAQMVKALRFPLCFLFLMLPLPGFIYRNITFPLQLLSSKWSVDLLHLFGVSAFREGNIIDMGFAKFQVVEACNGLRFILPLFTLGILIAFMGRYVVWKRVILIAATIPFALLANILRITGSGMVSTFWGAEAAQGFFHSFSGWAVFVLCLFLFVLLGWLLRHMPGQPSSNRGAHKTQAGETGSISRDAYRPSWLFLTALILFIVIAPVLIAHLSRLHARDLKKPFNDFPVLFGDYQGVLSEMDEAMWQKVGGQNYLLIDYRKPFRPPVNFYTAYYEYQRKAGDFIHSPKLCLPGAGWFIENNHTRAIAFQKPVAQIGPELKLNELLITNNNDRQLVYYWYQGRERNFTNEYMAKFYLVWDGVWRRRTDGALVRLIMPLDGMEIEEGRRILDRFALFVGHQLTEYLP